MPNSGKSRSFETAPFIPVTSKCVAYGEQFEAAFMALALDRLATHQDTSKGCGL